MASRSFARRTPAPDVRGGSPRLRPLAHRPGWSLAEYVCTAGPHDRPFEEQHDRVSVALVTAGTFRYRTGVGEALLYPGAFLLGNAGACYECGHEHSRGDRCVALHIDRELFVEIAAGSSGTGHCAFRMAALPALPQFASISACLQMAPLRGSLLALEERVLAAVGTIARLAATNHTPPRRPTAAATRRMAIVLEYIEARLGFDLCLTELSTLVAMSKYHFLRTFKHTSGMTPHQYILGRRLHAAAAALRTSETAVARIALDQGFGDLSTFNHAFRRVMGVPPTAYRATMGSPSAGVAIESDDNPSADWLEARSCS